MKQPRRHIRDRIFEYRLDAEAFTDEESHHITVFVIMGTSYFSLDYIY